MAEIRKLVKPKKGTPPAPAEAVENLHKPPSGANVPFQVRIPPETRREFKTYAMERDMDASQLFQIVWSFYKEHQG